MKKLLFLLVVLVGVVSVLVLTYLMTASSNRMVEGRVERVEGNYIYLENGLVISTRGRYMFENGTIITAYDPFWSELVGKNIRAECEVTHDGEYKIEVLYVDGKVLRRWRE